MKHAESNLQRQCVRWFRLQYPEPRYLIAAIPNGGHRNRITAAIMKGEGVRAGVPDLIIIGQNKIMFVEMKSDKGRLSDSQKEVAAIFMGNCIPVAVCNSFDLFQWTVNEWFKK